MSVKLKSRELAKKIAETVDAYVKDNGLKVPVAVVQIEGDDIRNAAGRICSPEYMENVARAFEKYEYGELYYVFGDEEDGDEEGELMAVLIHRMYDEIPVIKL